MPEQAMPDSLQQGMQDVQGPVRMCVICRQRFPKSALSRFVLSGTGTLASDAAHTMPGRGWYVCGQESCRQKFARYRPQTRQAARQKGRNKKR